VTAYETCWNCGGSGMQDYGGHVGECSRCNGDTVLRARDGKGRFTTVPDSEVQP
jgi:DnaJ-class molecular chaperone